MDRITSRLTRLDKLWRWKVITILYTANKKRKGHKAVNLIILVMFVIVVFELMVINRNISYADSNIDIVDEETLSDESSGNHTYGIAESGRNVIKEVHGVPIIGQLPELPSGCEAAAAAMLVRWAGVDVSKEEMAKSLPKGSLPVYRNGLLYGPGPDEVFIGDPFSDNGLGVYHGPVASAINRYLNGQVADITGIGFEDMLKVIDGGRPVVVWATMNMAKPSVCASWYDYGGRKITWIAPEHAFLLVGYTDFSVIVNDPYTGQRRLYPTSTFKSRWESMGRQAITVSDKIPGRAVVTDITSLKDEQGQASQYGSIPEKAADQEKKAEQVISEMSKNEAQLSSGKQYEKTIQGMLSKVCGNVYSYYKKIIELIYD